MSHAATNWAITQRGLKPATKLVLWYLCDRHNPDFGCFPSQETLADDAEMSRSSLNNHLNELESVGLIRRERRHADGGHKRMSSRYFLAFEKGFHAESHVQSLDMGTESHVQKTPESHVQNLDTNTVKEEPVKEEEDARARGQKFSDEDWERLILIAGYTEGTTGELPVWWIGTMARDHVQGWMDKYGFTALQVLETAAAARDGHDAPLNGPKGLDAAMARAFENIGRTHAAPTHAQQADILALRLKDLAARINAGRYVPSVAISNVTRWQLVEGGYCTDAQLKKMGHY